MDYGLKENKVTTTSKQNKKLLQNTMLKIFKVYKLTSWLIYAT